MIKKILLLLLVLLILGQLIRIDKSVPDTDAQLDLFAMHDAPADIKAMVKGACYDCHSYETVYPWQTEIAPVSWWIKGHIKNGRLNTNFSEWGSYDKNKRKYKGEECSEVLEDLRMPPKSYRFMHTAAQLSEDDRKKLADWFRKL